MCENLSGRDREKCMRIIDLLAQGRISPEEAKRRLDTEIGERKMNEAFRKALEQARRRGLIR